MSSRLQICEILIISLSKYCALQQKREAIPCTASLSRLFKKNAIAKSQKLTATKLKPPTVYL